MELISANAFHRSQCALERRAYEGWERRSAKNGTYLENISPPLDTSIILSLCIHVYIYVYTRIHAHLSSFGR